MKKSSFLIIQILCCQLCFAQAESAYPIEQKVYFQGALSTPIYSDWESSGLTPPSITVGYGDTDLQGKTNLCIQAGIDYTANIGGGVVNITAGKYLMEDSLHLRPNVIIRGAGESTVLFKSPMVESKLSAPFLGYGHWDVSLEEPGKFKQGMGINVGAGAFATTVATLTFQHEDRFGISRPLNGDCRGNDVVRNIFPIISGYYANDSVVENLKIDGNKEQNPYFLNGCRGGGIFLLHCDRAKIRNVIIEKYNGDGISLQQCQDCVVEDTVCSNNAGRGFHPGSGSMRLVFRRVSAIDNEMDGVFYCLRATNGIIEDSKFIGNKWNGITIGPRDSGNIIRNCVIKNNGHRGIFFRPVGAETLAPSETVISNCLIENNCQVGGEAEVHLASPVKSAVLTGNTIKPDVSKKDIAGILIIAEVKDVELGNNKIHCSEERCIVNLRKSKKQ